jgi:cytochrome c-type biogenesis protein CcmH
VRRALAAALATLALGAPAAAAAKCPQAALGDVEDEVMCPVCGTPLALATEAPQAQRERELIERLIADCRSKEEIKTRLVAEFGDAVLAQPDDQGFDLAAWIVPGLAFLLGGTGIALAAVRWRRKPNRARQDQASGTSERLDADIDRYDL